MKRIFVPEPVPNYDVTAFDGYELVVLNDNKANPFNVDSMRSSLARGLHYENFNPNEDEICMTGRSVALSMLMSVLVEMYDSDISLLVWDVKTKTYVSCVMTREGFSNELTRLKDRDR